MLLTNKKCGYPGSNESLCKKETWAFWLLFCFFGVKTLFFALRIREKLFPDEMSWFGMVEVFSRSFLLPVDSPESYPLGLITHVPNLYFFVLGKILPLNVFPVADLIFLRLVNVFMGLGAVYFAWKLVRLLHVSLSVRLLFITMLTNTMMYTFIFGSVNYDNLSSLLSVLSLYYTIRLIQKENGTDLLLFGVFIMAGLLTKNVFLPFAVALVLLLIVQKRRVFFDVKWFKAGSFQLTAKKLFLLLILLILVGANLKLYVGNIIEFGTIIPNMTQVLTVEKCLKNRLIARTHGANQFKADKISMLDAQRFALQVRDPGDRAFAWSMIKKVKQEKQIKEITRMGRLQYALEWGKYAFSRTYGVAAHLSMSKSDKELYPYYSIFLLAILLTGLKFRRRQGLELASLFFIAIFYLIVLMQVVNYQTYVASGFVGLALTGRYLFPVLVPLYILLSYGLLERMPTWWQWGVGLTVGGIFIYGELPWFLQNVTSNWYF